MMDPFIGSALIQAGSGLLGAFGISKNNDAQIKQAELNRKFQAEENQKTREWNERMWRMANAYNDPSAEMARLRRAGLNPNLMYGDSSSLSPAQTISNSAGASGAMPHTDPVVSADIGRTLAETRLLNAQADNVGEDTKTKFTYNKFQEQLLKNEIAMGQAGIRYKNAMTDLTEPQKKVLYAQADNLFANTDKVMKSIDKIDSEIANIDADTAIKQIEAVQKDARFEVEMREAEQRIKESMSREGLNIAKTREIVTLLPYVCSNISSQTSLNIAKKYNVEMQTEGERSRIRLNDKLWITYDKEQKRMDFELENDKTFRSAERLTRLAGEWQDILFKPIDTVTDIIGTLFRRR
ncbi:DNA pilot protein [Microvirus mar50]|uniref:DNA pilot protein n=1 Tax=Microvirus mar50 TaxID=2851186 RepID=A0A8F5MKR6_9VIRU|nr:DNA pilot protein [Microvirus mar50]